MKFVQLIGALGVISITVVENLTVNWLKNYNHQLLAPSYDGLDTIYLVQRSKGYSIAKYIVSTSSLIRVLDIPLSSQSNLIFASANNGGDIWFFTQSGVLYKFSAKQHQLTIIISTKESIQLSSSFLVQSDGIYFISSNAVGEGIDGTNESCHLRFLNFATNDTELIGTFSKRSRNRLINLISDESGSLYIFASGGDSESSFFVVRNARMWENSADFMEEPLEGKFEPMLGNILRVDRFWVAIEATKVSYLQLGRRLAMSESVDFSIQNNTNYKYTPVYVGAKLGIYVFAESQTNYNNSIGFIQTCQHGPRPSVGSKFYGAIQWTTFRMYCDVPRSPKSIVEWKRTFPDRLLEDYNYDSFELLFPYIQILSAGFYTCLAENICGYESRLYFIDVRPRYSIKTRRKVQNVKIGSKAELECGDVIEKEKYIPTHILWLQDNKILRLSADYRIQISLSNQVKITDVLQSDNETIYTCLLDVTKITATGNESYAFDIEVQLNVTQNHTSELGVVVSQATTVSINYILFAVFATVVCMVGICLYFTYKNTRVQGLTTEEIERFRRGQFFGEEVTELHADYEDKMVYEKLPYDNTFELDPNVFQIERENILGQGQFGIVYKGVLKVGDKLEDVAIKTTKPGQDVKELKNLLSEIKIMIFIGQHPHIIRFLGAFTRQLKIGIAYIAVELCSNGSLERYLRNAKHATDLRGYAKLENTEIKLVTSEQQSEWSYQIAIGMEYLASKNVIHADLATRNIMLDSELAIRITDFGLSRKLDKYDNYVKTGNEPLPWRWMAIESLESKTFSTESDVWSYGVTLWEIYSMGKVPYHNQPWSADFFHQLKSGDRLQPPPHSVEELYDVMSSCWDADPKNRPSFKELATLLLDLTYKNQSINYHEVLKINEE